MANDRLDLEKIPSQNLKMELRQRNRALRNANDGLFDSYDEPHSEEANHSSINVRELWLMIRRRKWLVLIIIAMVTTIVSIQMFRIKSYYQADTIIEIGKDSASIGNQGVIVTGMDELDPQYMVNIKTKMLMFTSRSLLEDVVVNLKLDQNPYFLDSEKRTWFGSGNKKESPENLPTSIPAELEDAITRSPAESARLAPYVKVISENLNVQQVRDTRAITLSFTHDNAQIAAQVANEITRIFRDRIYSKKTENLGQTEDWLKKASRTVKAELEKAQDELARYAREKNIVSLNKGTDLVSQQLGDYQTRLQAVEAERIKAETFYDEVKKGNVAKLPAEFDDKTRSKILDLEKQINEAKTAKAKLETKYGPDNPSVQEINNQIGELEKQIATGTKSLEEKFKADYERAVREEKSIKTQRDSAKVNAVDQNQAGIKLAMLQQEVETKEKLYKDLSDKAQQAELKKKEQTSNITIISPAYIPNIPAGPRRLLSIMLAFLLSGIAAIGLAFFLEYLDNTIKTVEDVERYAQLPALGVIPAIATSTSLRKMPINKSDSDLLGEGNSTSLALSGASLATQLMTLDNQSTVAEAYRALRTSVLLSSAGHPPKSILVTSGRPGEGKTTTAVNTAISLAQLGASVLIIDCDLRRPKVHKVFGITHVHGLSTYLSRDVELDELIHPLPIPNLSLLPCGPTPPNPAELISSEKMRDLLILLGEKYDHIIIDSPPLINVTDPVILSTMVDGVIMVVHAGKSTRDVIRRASQELTGVGAKVFGVVLNNVNLQREGYDEYYYQRYYSGYYGTTDTERERNGKH